MKQWDFAHKIIGIAIAGVFSMQGLVIKYVHDMERSVITMSVTMTHMAENQNAITDEVKEVQKRQNELGLYVQGRFPDWRPRYGYNGPD